MALARWLVPFFLVLVCVGCSPAAGPTPPASLPTPLAWALNTSLSGSPFSDVAGYWTNGAGPVWSQPCFCSASTRDDRANPAFDPFGDVWFNADAATIVGFHPDGTQADSLVLGEMLLAFGTDGSLYGRNSSRNAVDVFARQGRTVTRVRTLNLADVPCSVSAGPSGDVYVASCGGVLNAPVASHFAPGATAADAFVPNVASVQHDAAGAIYALNTLDHALIAWPAGTPITAAPNVLQLPQSGILWYAVQPSGDICYVVGSVGKMTGGTTAYAYSPTGKSGFCPQISWSYAYQTYGGVETLQGSPYRLNSMAAPIR